MQDAIAMAGCVARELGIEDEQVLVASTGVIGEPMDVRLIESAAPELVGSCRPEGISDFAEAIIDFLNE